MIGMDSAHRGRFTQRMPRRTDASTTHPAFAMAIASRAVGNQCDVAATRIVGFNFVQSSDQASGSQAGAENGAVEFRLAS